MIMYEMLRFMADKLFISYRIPEWLLREQLKSNILPYDDILKNVYKITPKGNVISHYDK